ncbi:single-stranded-DNA-specific exonuclease RecJ [Allobacillus sp. GCM10007491]|uniref:Single-stranded-DNA-specific exonuclease RecJ n=1 Tax=Allobacillus saliphilus TaxID=2912308 RepID=A0A941CT77_9BACI|nr:single-stranded-DNA-specific exonuclease RecJ [Allobacillus saliphilus]MBR7553392.1 single-stranded-DNA-specific exonuclease RecJ [Allobacillus saliphilus]
MLESKMNWLVNNQLIDEPTNIHSSPIVNRMLAKRKIHSKEEAESFLYPTKKQLHDPFLFDEMDAAVNRIHKAIQTQEKVMIYGDYDADGVTSTAIMVSVLRKMGADVDYYIPNRFTEGYGPNELAFQAIKAHGVGLIITVDNGIAAPKEAKLARELGMDLIITDHHEEQDELPESVAMIHPKLSADYPFNHLAGAGVALKLAHALTGELQDDYLALASIGTVADLVPMIGENRVIVKEGLKALTYTKMPGLMALKNIGKLKGHMTTENIGFVIGPRLNAVGRLQDAGLAVDLLLEDDAVLAAEMALEIDQINKERQKLVQQIFEEANEMIEANYLDDHVFIIAKKDWNPGVLGIVASRIINKYNRPTLMLSIDDTQQVAKGSARSIPAFDIFKHGMELKHLFVHFGGHPQAAGMTVRTEDIEELRHELNRKAASELTPADFHPTLQIEEEINWEEVDMDFPELVEMLAPFGMDNNRPVFQINNVEIKELRKIGAKSNHLKLTGIAGGKQLEAVGFQIGDVVDRLSMGSKIDLAGEVQINEWNGNRKLQVLLKDLRCNEWQLFDFRGKRFTLPPTISPDELTAIYFQPENKPEESEYLTVHAESVDELNQLQEHKHLLIHDLPNRLEELENVLGRLSFHTLYACYQIERSSYFERFPSREVFKDLFKTIKKHQIIQQQQRYLLAEAKKMSEDDLDFIIQVFFDLDFVKIIDGDIFYIDQIEPKQLSESITYQQRLNRIKMEKTLYYSNYNELKEWISMRRGRQGKEGVVLHGL